MIADGCAHAAVPKILGCKSALICLHKPENWSKHNLRSKWHQILKADFKRQKPKSELRQQLEASYVVCRFTSVDPSGGVSTERLFHLGFPVFSPDGRYLVWGSNRNQAREGETNVFIAEWVE